jgi:hypothetical protein
MRTNKRPRVPGQREQLQPPYGGADRDARYPARGPQGYGPPPTRPTVPPMPHSLRDQAPLLRPRPTAGRPDDTPPPQRRQQPAANPPHKAPRTPGGRGNHHVGEGAWPWEAGEEGRRRGR